MAAQPARVRVLHARAVEAARAYRPELARRYLLRGLESLDAAQDTRGLPGSAADLAELAELRVRLLVTLGWAEAERTGTAAGLTTLRRAQQVLAAAPPTDADELPDEQRRALRGLVAQQRGLVLLRAGRAEDAVLALHEAVPVLRTALLEGVGDPAVLGHTLLNLGIAELSCCRVGAARRALGAAQHVADSYDLPTLAAKAHHDLGYAAAVVGDVPAALRHYADTAAVYAAGGNEQLLATLELDRARALLSAGLGAPAADHADRACALLSRGGSAHELAEALVARAAALLLCGQPEQARLDAEDAQRRFRRIGNHAWAALAHLACLRADDARAAGGDPRPARRTERTLARRCAGVADELTSLGLPDEAAVARLLAVRSAVRVGALDQAGELLACVPPPRLTSPVDTRALRHLARAELAQARGHTGSALAAARNGLDELARRRDRLGALDLVQGSAAHGQQLSRLGLRLTLARPHPVAAHVLAWCERARSQAYRYEPVPRQADPQLRAQIEQARTLRRAAQQARLASRRVPGLERRCAQAEAAALQLGWHSLPAGRPRRVLSAAELAERLGPDRALVCYLVSDGALAALTLAAGRCRLVPLGASAPVEELLQRLLADLTALAPDTLAEPVAQVVAASASRCVHALDRALLRPLAAQVGDRPAVMVPTGSLHALPWGSLPSMRCRPVVVAPSATAWAAAEERTPSDRPVVLVQGPGLPGAAAETAALLGLLPAARVLTGAGATAQATLDALDGARLAYLAAHGSHAPENALFSRLELFDGPLFAHELLGLRRPPAHVVLSACELGRQQLAPGDEPLGFAGALLAAGVRTVVAAATRVGERAAVDTAVLQHQQLAQGFAPAAALAAAVAVDPLRRPFVCIGAGL